MEHRQRRGGLRLVGIDRELRWRAESDTPSLVVVFDRSSFGGTDTWHIGREDVNLPFFEPIDSGGADS